MTDEERDKIRADAEFTYDLFKSLPDRAQKMWFEYCEISHKFKNNRNLDYLCKNQYALATYIAECKSPIELIFGFAYDLVSYDVYKRCPWWLYPQQEVEVGKKRYYLDFAYDGLYDLKIGVECDGHDFHEKTKEQVARNNERDYNLKMAGWEILHFSGSQIYNNPFKCASQTINFIEKEFKKQKDGRC